jgi:carbamoyltransferase
LKRILGLSAYYHDAAAALVVDGCIVAAAQEERFTRRRHDAGFPAHAARFCLAHAGLRLRDLDAVVFYDKPFLKFERLLETYLASAPHGLRSFVASMPVWLKEKLFLKSELRRRLDELCGPWGTPPPLLFSEHHRSHAASAFYPSPFESAAVLCLDGVGEWATTSAWLGQGTSLQPLWEQHFPHSLGLLYSAFTYYTGFKVNSGEYKMMGLAPYGTPRYADAIREHLVDVKPDGTFRLDMRYFDYATGLRMTSERFHALFGAPPRDPAQPIVQHTMDVAASIQQVTDEIVLRLAKTLRAETGARHLCLAGGVALNCVTNGRLVRERVFDDVWIQPAAGDAGGALGAALVAWYAKNAGAPRLPARPDAMSGALLGPETGDEALEAFLRDQHLPHETLPDDAALGERVAALLADGAVVGWVQGRMEFGPRALGARSILADPRRPDMQRALNLKIKFRESFRPFAPAVLREHVGEWFEIDTDSPYMLLVADVTPERRIPVAESAEQLWGIDKLNVPRSTVPAITHVDYSARIQTVRRETSPLYYDIISAFNERTGCPIIINTSFNVRGEPIVCTPEDAYRCFMRSNIDVLVLENFVLEKAAQPARQEDESWKQEFVLD